MILQEYVFALVAMWVQHVLSGDLLASNYSKVSHSGTVHSSASIKISPSHLDQPFATNLSVVIGVEPKDETTKRSFFVYAERVTEGTAYENNEGTLPISEARMSSGDVNLKPAIDYLPQDTEYYTGQVYAAQERKEANGSDHPASSMLGRESSKLKAEQSESQPPLLTTDYSSNGQGNLHKASETFHPKEVTRDKDSKRNDPDKQAHFLKLPQDSYNGPDSYHTTTPVSSKSKPQPPLGMYELETPEEDYNAPDVHYLPPKPKESVTRHRYQHKIPSSTQFYKPIMLDLQPPDSNEPYHGHMDGYQFEPPKEIYEPQMGGYQYANMKESMKQTHHTQKPPKPREPLTPPSDTYHFTQSEDSFTTPAKILQPPKSKDSFKPPINSYHAIKPEVSLTTPVDMHNHPESEDLLKDYMDVHKPPKPQDIRTPPADMYGHPKLKYSYKPQLDRPQPPKQMYVSQGVMESSRPLPAKAIHKPLVLSPEEFYKPPMETQIPPKDDNKMPSSSETLKGLSHSSALTHANNQSENTDDDIYFDYDPSTYVQKENSNVHNDSHEHDYSEKLKAPEDVYSHEYDHIDEHLHAPEHDHSHKYPSHHYSGFYLHRPPPSPPNHSDGAPPPPPKELKDVMPQPPKDKLEAPPTPAKKANGSLSPSPSEPHEAPPPSSKEPYGAPPPLHIAPYGAPMYLPKPPYAAPQHPPNYDYGIHAYGYPYGVPPPPPTTILPPQSPPKRKRVGYYYIGRKLYLVPAVFSFLFLPYVLAYIIKSIIRHKVNLPFQYWQTARKIDLDENETERRVARALEAVEKKYE